MGFLLFIISTTSKERSRRFWTRTQNRKNCFLTSFCLFSWTHNGEKCTFVLYKILVFIITIIVTQHIIENAKKNKRKRELLAPAPLTKYWLSQAWNLWSPDFFAIVGERKRKIILGVIRARILAFFLAPPRPSLIIILLEKGLDGAGF